MVADQVSIKDVAQYILEKKGTLTALQLQKLCYYAQAWSLVWDDEPLFGERIEAWASGPVAPVLYNIHRGFYQVSEIRSGDPSKLNAEQRVTVDAVLREYGDRTAGELATLTHQEAPWQDARQEAGLKPGERSTVEITLASMAEFYGLFGAVDPDEGLEVTPEIEAKLLRALDAPPAELLTSEQMRRRLNG